MLKFKIEKSEQFSFIQVPKEIIKLKGKLSYGAKLVYGLCLDRMSLSRKNRYVDENGDVYIFYSAANIAADMECSVPTARKMLNELETIHLIEIRKNYAQNGAQLSNKMYIYDWTTATEEDKSLLGLVTDNIEHDLSENPPEKNLSTPGKILSTPRKIFSTPGKIFSPINNKYNKTEMNHTDYQSNQSECEKIPKENQGNKLSASDHDGLIDRLKSILPSNNLSDEQIQNIYNLASVISETNDENLIMKHLTLLWTRMQDYKYNRKNEYRYFLNVINNAGPIKDSTNFIQKSKKNMKSKPSYDLDAIFEYALNSTPVIKRSDG